MRTLFGAKREETPLFKNPPWAEQYQINAATLRAIAALTETVALLREEIAGLRR